MRIASSLLLLAAGATRIGGEPTTQEGFFLTPSVEVKNVQTSNPFPNGVQTSNPFPNGNAVDVVTDPRLEGIWYTAKGDPKLIDHYDQDKYLVLKVTPTSETTSIKSKDLYERGRLEIEVSSTHPVCVQSISHTHIPLVGSRYHAPATPHSTYRSSPPPSCPVRKLVDPMSANRASSTHT